MKRKNISKSVRENIWKRDMPKVNNIFVFDGECTIQRCNNKISAYTFEIGHNIPWSIGGKDVPDNFRVICSTCNRSMGNQYTCDG